MYYRRRILLCLTMLFWGAKAYSAGWSTDSYVEKIYLTAQDTVIIKVTGNTNINDCLLVDGYQFILKNGDQATMFELFKTAFVNNMKVKIYSEQCQSSSWINVDNRVSFNQVSKVIISK